MGDRRRRLRVVLEVELDFGLGEVSRGDARSPSIPSCRLGWPDWHQGPAHGHLLASERRLIMVCSLTVFDVVEPQLGKVNTNLRGSNTWRRDT